MGWVSGYLMVDVGSALLLSATIIIIGYVANELSSKFALPDILIILAIGLLLGPVLGVI